MPKIIADSHEFMMKEFLETSVSKIMGNERMVFP